MRKIYSSIFFSFFLVFLSSVNLRSEQDNFLPGAIGTVDKDMDTQIRWVEEQPGESKTAPNVYRGSWWSIKEILKQTRGLYDKVRAKVSAMKPLAEVFGENSSKVYKKLNLFYSDYGFKAGEADERIDLFIEEIKEIEEKGEELSDTESSTLKELIKKKEEVEEFKKELENLQKLEGTLREAMVVLQTQVARAKSYEDISWDYYEKIENVRNDSIARDYYQKIENAFENLVGIENYLNGEFKQFFDNMISSIDEQMEKIKQRVDRLGEYGITVGKKMRNYETQKETELKEKSRKERERLEKELKEAKRPWYSKLVGYIAHPFKVIYKGITYPFRTFYGWVTGLVKGPVPQGVKDS